MGMSREHLYKAKRVNWTELPKEEWWVDGYYVKCRGHHYILPVYDEDHGFDERYADWVEVEEETVCEYTGFSDKNGRKIFDKDIVKDGDNIWVVFWDKYNFEIGLKNKEESFGIVFAYPGEIEVIGNIFDNPELLKGDEAE